MSPSLNSVRAWIVAGLAATILLLSPVSALSNPDLPNPPANIELIPAGSLVIPMDNDKQNLGGLDFNLTAYGLATHLLHGGIPLKWAITAGKAKDGIDFSAESRQLFPSVGGTAVRDFRAGPFIIHRDFVGLATPIIASFANSVVVHELTQDATADIRYDLLNKPKIAVFDDGGKADVHGDLLLEAGFVENLHYEIISAATLVTINANACFTFGSEPHWNEDPADPLVDTASDAIRQFVEGGGNFLAQCAAIETYENNPTFGLFKSTNGIEVNNTGNALFDYANPDLSFSQFEDELDSGGGSVHDWVLLPPAPPNTWRGATQFHVQNIPAPQQIAASATKLTAGIGSLVYYLGTHSFGDGNIEEINGRRMYLNAVMTPSGRPQACLLEIETADLSGTVYEDTNGDSQLFDAVGAPGVRVRIYADNNDNGVVDAGDAFFAETTTDGSGNYSFTVSTSATGTRYLVAVDSKSLAPSAGLNGGFTQGDVWAQQTYGDNPATPAPDVASRFGGRTPAVSDDVDPADTSPAANNYQHLARADVTAGDATGLNFGFSFNAHTHVRDGDDDATAARSIQGSLRQFMQNANAIVGAQSQRFVPTVAANSGSWWTVTLGSALPVITDAFTTVDGRAYDFADGTTIRDLNPGTSGNPEPGFSGSKDVGTGPDGREGTGDELQLPDYFRPELEIDANDQGHGFEFAANDGTVRRVSITNIAGGDDGVLFSAGSGGLATENFIGLRADGSDPDLSVVGTRIAGAGIYVNGGSADVVGNFVGFTGDTGIQAANQSLVEGNELYRVGLETENDDAITAEGSTGQAITVRRNRVWFSNGYGIESWQASGPFTLEDNSIINTGQLDVGSGETGGIRVFGNSSIVRRNVVTGAAGAGIVVSYGMTPGNPSQQNRISRNAVYGNGGLGIDLDQLNVVGNPNGDGVTVNDGATDPTKQNLAVDFPVLVEGRVSATDLSLRGFARPGAVIELFVAAADPSGFGEGQTYLLTVTESGTGAGGDDPVADLDAGTGSYTNPVNGLNQGADPSANRFRFTIPLGSLPGVAVGTVLTATGRDVSNNTSEFSGNLTLIAELPPVANDDAAATATDTLVNVDVRANDTDANGDPLTITAFDTPTANGGTTSINDNGTPADLTDDTIDYTPALGFAGVDTFDYTIEDGNGGSDTATVTVTVANGAPDAVDDVASTATDTLVNVDVRANDTDANGDPLTITAFDTPTANGGTTSINDNGTPADLTDDTIDYTPALGFAGVDTFDYTIEDGNGGSDTATVTVTVANGAPDAVDDVASTATDTLVNVDVRANDTDANGDPLTITAFDNPTANGGTTSINDNGTPADLTDDTIDYTPALGFAGVDTFDYTIEDGNGGSDTATVTVTVANGAPDAVDDVASTATDTLVNVDVRANDTDANGDPLTITAFDNPTANGGTTSINDNGTPADLTDDTIDYTPALGFAGVDTFDYTIEDGNGGSDTATVTVTVANGAPDAVDDVASTATDTLVNVDVRANDTDANGDPLTITAFDTPTANGGTTSINDNGTPADLTDDTIDYTPALGFAGVDTFDYTIEDGNGGSDTATVTVTVANGAPDAVDDVASTATDTPVAIDVLANDTDANGDPLTITAFDNPTANGGTTSINDNGTPADLTDDTIDYTPALGFAGVDTFDYTIEDGNGGSDTATVTVTVANGAPDAVDDVASTATDTLVNVDVRANDTDANGDPLTITAFDNPTANGGTTSINDNGTPADLTDDTIDYTPALGFAGVDTFDYTIEDGNGGSDTATVTVTVANGAPDAVDDVASTATDTLVNVDVRANDTDANGDPLTITAFDNPTANGGTTSINDNGTPADLTDDTIDYTPALGFAGVDTFDYTIEDGNGGSDTATVTVTVANGAPDAVDDVASTATDTLVNVDVRANDTDANGDPLTITAFDNPTANGGTTSINDNGTPADLTDDTIDYTPALGFAGVDTFDYTIEDGNGGSDTATVTVTVANGAPDAVDDVASTATDTLVNVDVRANDTDANGDPLTITAFDNPTANGGTTSINDNGTPADLTDDTIDYTPALGFAGVDTFDYTIEDGNGGSDTATVTVTVANGAPDAVDDVASTATDTLVNVDVRANDTDANGDPLTITAFDNPTANGGTTSINDNGTPADLTDDTIDYTPALGFAGVDTFDYTIEDGNGGSDTATVTVTVANGAPDAVDDVASTATDTLVNVDVRANDTDANGDPLTITAFDNPTANGGTTSINDNGTPADLTDDTIDYTPALGFAGVDTFDYTIEDGNGGSDTATVTVTVANGAPDAVDDVASTATDTLVNVDVRANDTDANGDPLTITAFDNPTANGGTTSINDNGTPADLTDDTIDYTPALGFAGVDTFDYTIEDGNGGSDTATVTVTVANGAPDAVDDVASTATDTLVNVDVRANDTDANGDPLTITAFDNPTANGGTTSINDNGTPADLTDDTIDYTPALGFAGVDTFDYTIEDGNGGSDTATVTVTVANGAPDAVDDVASTATDTLVNVDVRANDTDANGDPLTITAFDNPTANGGTTSINDNGTPADLTDDTIDYTPALGFAGVDTFDYTIEDGNGGSDTATVTVTVANGAPDAVDDVASTATDTLVNVDVRANDTDANGDPLTITAFDNPTANGGTTSINDNGTPADLTDDTIDYTPALGFAGVDTFDYTIEDGNGGSDTATVTVTVANGAPDAVDDVASTATDTLVNVDVRANDTDANGDPLTITAFDNPTANGGTTSINDNGTPADLTDDTIDYTPALGFAGVDTFDYTIEDGNGGSDTATVTVTVANGAPVAVNDSDATEIDVAKDIDVLLNDFDPNGDLVTIVFVQGLTDQGGTAGINNNGTPGDPTDDTITFTPLPGFVGTDTFTYTIDDGNGGTDTATVSVTMPPFVADLSMSKIVDNAAPNAGTTVVFTLTVNNAGPDTADVQISDSLPTGYAYVSDDGTGAYNPGSGIWSVTGLLASSSAQLNITVTVNAVGDYTNVAEVVVSNANDPNSTPGNNDPAEDDYASITPVVNNPPVAVDDATSTATDTPVAIDVLANDTDANGDPLTLIASDTPTANGGITSINDNGTPGNSTDDFVDYTPDMGFAGADTFDYTIEDGNGGSDTATVTVTVANGAPDAVDDVESTPAGTAVAVDVLANDSDPNGDSLTITASDSPSANGGSTTININGTPGDPTDDFIHYDPAPGFAGSDTFTYTISDGNGGSDTATVTVTVANGAPDAVDDVASTATDTLVNVDVRANDTDANGDPLTITAFDNPTANGGTTSINDNGTPADLTDDTIDYTPALGFAGVDTFDYTIEDGNGGSDTATVTVTVANGAPDAVDDVASTATDTLVNVDVRANDTDANGDPLTITAFDNPTANGGTTSINDNGTPADLTDDTIDYTPALGFAGVDTFDYTIEDGNGGSDTATVTIAVENAPPVAVDDAASTAAATAVSVPVLANDSDPNGDALSLVSATSPTAAGGTAFVDNNGSPANPSDDTVRYTPPVGFAGVDTFSYGISDGNGGTASATVSVTVANAPPDAVDDTAEVSANSGVSISVLANDSDSNGDPLNLTLPSNATTNGGSVTVNDGGTPGDLGDDFVIYTAPPSFVGADTFTYDISDGQGGTSSATVTVTVIGGTDGVADITDSIFPGDTLDLSVADADLNKDSAVTETVTVTVANDATGESEQVSLSETGDDTGVFQGTLPTTSGAAAGTNDDGRLVTRGGDTVTIRYLDEFTSSGASATRSDTGVVEQLAGLRGTAWFDKDSDDLFDADEEPVTGWNIEVRRGGMLLGSAQTSADGTYAFDNLRPDSGYSIVLIHPLSDAVWDTLKEITLPAGTTLVDQNLPVDPSGVVYDSVTRAAIAGATVTITEASGQPLPDECLLDGQQDQVTDTDGGYRFDVNLDADFDCESGDEFGIRVTPPFGYNPGPSQIIPPLAGPLDVTGEPDPFRVAPQSTAPQAGEPTDHYLAIELDSGDPDVINNHIPMDPLTELDLRLIKRVLSTRVSVGDFVRYVISAENTGPLTFRSLALRDEIPAGFAYVDGSARRSDTGVSIPVAGTRPVDLGSFDLDPGESIEIEYLLRVGPGVTTGDYVNRVSGVVGDFRVGATASASVAVSSDADFGETTIIGKVFDDVDGDGWQDPEEEGIPGVRLATVTGLLIETDQTGRYHLEGIDGGLLERGRNFILKVDQATLPAGSIFTTENPRVLRVTQGFLNQVNFGVRLPAQDRELVQEIEVKLGEVFFVTDGADVRPEFQPLLKELAERLREQGGGQLTIEGNAVLERSDYTVTPHFATRSAQLADADKAELDAIINQWRDAAHVNILVAGHTDNVPIASQNRGEYADNYALSQARATTVADHLARGLGVAAESARAVGRGPDEPVASNAIALGRAANRRVEVAFSGYRVREYSVPVQGVASPQDLPTRRAMAIYDALKAELGELIMNKVEIRVIVHPPSPATSSTRRDSSISLGDRARRIAARGLLAVLGLVAGPAYADEPCTVDLCKTEEGYAIQIINHVPERPAGPADTRYARQDKRRVDVSGKFKVRLPLDGLVWATEDPSAAEPRLAIRGPVNLPVENGAATKSARFTIYTNYAAFVSSAELLVFEATDTDLVAPLVVLPLRLTGLDRVDWDGQRGDGRPLEEDEELAYMLRVVDKAGRADETRLQTLRLVNARDFEAATDYQVTAEVPASEADPEKLTPLNGNVLVMRPPSVEIREYTLAPRFDTRKAELNDGDKEELDKIIVEWADHETVQVIAVGHTDNVRIAPENRDEYANNQALSEARARTVGEYLQKGLGLPGSNVAIEGRGPSEPVAGNETPQGRALNRRVELRITGQRVLQYTDLRLVDPTSGKEERIFHSLDEAENLLAARTDEEKAASNEDLVTWRSGIGLVGVYGQNDLAQQNIPIYGSRVRVYGHGVTEGMELTVNGHPLPVDRGGRFAVEYLMPVGRHRLEVGFKDAANKVRSEVLDVEVTGRHMFLVGLADVTLSGSDLSGSIEPLAGDERYQDDFLVEGRLAFYLKGKVKGKYLVTAQMDTQEEELGDLFKNIHRKDPRAVFRRLDPDKYYPVYGDDSTTYSDTDTQGRMYVRVDWDKSQALWGNYHTGVTGNEFGQYNRSLYGARLRNRSLETTELGEAKREATVFLSEAQTALGHSEFLGTGGSLYYLRHQDILPGSEKAHIEIRDRDSNRVVNNVTLVRGTDYEIDELQGRMILTRPLAQITQQFAPSLIKDEPLDGNDVVLLVDYEYVPDAFDPDHLTVGGRGKQWLNDKVAVGVTAVDENRGSGEDYQLLGADVTLQAGRGTYLKAEIARTEASQAPVFYSDNGGLTFATTNPVAEANREGDALALEGRVNLREQGLTENDWTAASWWRQSEAGFSAARRDTGTELTEYGAEVSGQLNERLRLSTRLAVVERAGQSEQQRIAIQGDYRLGSQGTLSAEVRRHQVDDLVAGTSLENTLAALRYTYRLNNDLEVYGTGQFTVSNDDGVANNDLGSVGARWRVGEKTNLAGEYSSGDRGDAATLSLDHRINSDHRVFGAYTMSTDRTDRDGNERRFSLGNRSRISNQTTVFTESQFSRGRRESGVTHAFGLNFIPRSGWDFGLSLQRGELEALSGKVERDAATLTGGFRNQEVQWHSKLEYRDDAGAEQREQWLSSNRGDWRMSESMRMLLRFNISDTDDLTDPTRDARFVEGGLGIAYRPENNDRLNLLGRYTYLYDLPSIGQLNAANDQRSHVLSVEGIYRINPKWELGAKLSQRHGELRLDRNGGQWFDSTANFAAIRGRYHLIRRWDGVLEYRWLEVEENGSTRTGLLAAIDRHFGEHFKVGVGYNFTDFSDDLTDLDYGHKGWFLNLVGKY